MSDLKRFEHLKVRLEDIKSATNNFAEDRCIGKGGFGKVYKGVLVHFEGHSPVALKCLDRAFGQGDREFWNEILMLSLYKHDNIVPLLGFCDDHAKKVLVYEYASRRGLDLYINSDDLNWVRRLKICIGAARGLAYLHDPAETQQRVLHRDIKCSNILLDEKWKAMIADFGLSKFCPAGLEYTFLFSNPVGTCGYWDPLYMETGLLTKESDVYSFGVVLFEVLCGRLCTSIGNKPQSFTELVRKHYKENNLNGIIFGNIKNAINTSSLELFASIAYQCLKRDRHKRPLMNEILTKLETALEYQQNDMVDMSAMSKVLQPQDSVSLQKTAKRGSANPARTDAERLRRTLISQKIVKLQEAVPNMDKKTNLSDMLGLAVDYINELHKGAEAGPSTRQNEKRKGATVKIGSDDVVENSKKPNTKAATAALGNTVDLGDRLAPNLNQEKEHAVDVEMNQDSDNTNRKKEDLVGFSMAGQTTTDMHLHDDVVATGDECVQVEADLVSKTSTTLKEWKSKLTK